MNAAARHALRIVLLALGVGCAGPRRLAPFRTDGCSLFPDGDWGDRTRWRACCVEHDRAYWAGGTRAEREAADLRLHDCILASTGDARLAALVFEGVRLGGSPVFPSWYRWGYGWSYGRGYKPLGPEERKRVDRLLAEAAGP